MKICITSNGTTLDDQIDPRFGKAKNFLIVETAHGVIRNVEVVENLSYGEDEQNGVKAAQQVKDLGIEALISCKVGDRALETLHEMGIKVLCMSGNIRANIDEFIAGEHSRLSAKGKQ